MSVVLLTKESYTDKRKSVVPKSICRLSFFFLLPSFFFLLSCCCCAETMSMTMIMTMPNKCVSHVLLLLHPPVLSCSYSHSPPPSPLLLVSAAAALGQMSGSVVSNSRPSCKTLPPRIFLGVLCDASKKLQHGCPPASLFPDARTALLSWVLLPLLLSYSFPAFCAADVNQRRSSLATVDTMKISSYYEEFVSEEERESSRALGRRIEMAVHLLEEGKQAQAEGDYNKALFCYSEVKNIAGDLALADYARVGHAISLYEVGDRAEAILEMEDMSIILKGYPEVHAALAAVLYADKHAPIPAERQFTIATLLDPRYSDLTYVKESKHWPPSLICSLEKFITLK